MTADGTRFSVNHFSESAFTVKGHGVHSAFVDCLEALRAFTDIDVFSNSLRRTDVTHLHTVGPASALVLFFSKRSVATAHITAESLVGSVIGGKLFTPIWRKYLAWFYNHADVVLSFNGAQEAELRQGGVMSKVVTVHSGVWSSEMPSRTRARALLGIADDEQVVLSVGQVQPRKAVSVFHRTANEFPNVRFIWVGGFPFGPLTADYWEMRRLIRQRPANVVHTGQLSRQDVLPYYAAADIYLHPSHHEHAPVAVFEAAAARLPLVLRDLECYRKLYPGRYLAATDASFSAQIRRLLTERNLHRMLADHAVALADLYSSSRLAADLADIYRRLA